MMTFSKKLIPNFSLSIDRFQILLFIVLFAAISCGNDNEEERIANDTELCLVEIDGVFQEMELDENPQYLNGGGDGLGIVVGENLTYPAEARENGVEGLCVINYEITEEGKVENIVAIEDPGAGIGDTTIETIESATEGTSFSPGILDGMPVRVKKEMEIKFKLEG